MALILKQPGIQPLGQFDGLDSTVFTLKGGEVVTFKSVVSPNPPGTDKAAADDFDGYVLSGQSGQLRPVIDVVTTGYDGYRPLMLADEGIAHYGTLFGTVVGATVGQVAYGPNSTVASTDLLGPHTAKGSGKVTCWDKPGLYAVTLDAVDTNANTGLQPTNPTLFPGAQLYISSDGTGRLTAANGAHLNSTVVARFVEFESNGSLVTTPNRLVAAVNSPSGNVTSVMQQSFFDAVIWFGPGMV